MAGEGRLRGYVGSQKAGRQPAGFCEHPTIEQMGRGTGRGSAIVVSLTHAVSP
jgi:hypothetical protein